MNDQDLYFIPINEIARRLDIPAHTLRYWEKQFSGAIRPVTGAGGRRYYRPEVVEKIATIKTLLYDRGMTIAGVKKMMHSGEFSNVENVVPIETEKPIMQNMQHVNTDELDFAIDLLKQASELL